ncbi:hypothetical protein SAMN05428959_101387 [Duganella sp. CF517]|uniref:hypothetical protein n=1 Tax=Duganella sp. CF517 TaxID=1881038 RepID=UPI0008AEF765|nr:hypothetical protein [Duganella sp. CF517]SEN14493.1 hypothetical protein SAMN05428959_101387 [Duganella sp. CF517]
MKRLNASKLVIGAAGWAMAMAAAVQARQQSEPEQQSVPVPYKASQAGAQVRIELPQRYRKMWPQDYDDYRRGYTLSNGQTLAIAPRGMHMYARIDDGQWHQLVAAAPNAFVALDRQLQMEINLLGDDQVSGWVAMVVPQRTLANGLVVPERTVRLAVR